MAMCENCGKSGYAPRQMFVQNGQAIVGVCCATEADVPLAAAYQAAPQAPLRVVLPLAAGTDVEYGVKMSNKEGVHAYFNYGGLQVSFDRSAADIRRWAVDQGFIEAPKKAM